MDKKKLVIMASTLILAAATVAGGTLAYFTHSVDVNNIVTMGNVKISLVDDTPSPTNSFPIVPGQRVAKTPTIRNVGTNDCYVRANIDAWLTGDNDARSDIAVDAADLVTLLPDWTQGIGENDNTYYYLNETLAASKLVASTVAPSSFVRTEPGTIKLFHDMVIPTSWGNKYQGLCLNLKITAHAIQANNFTPVKGGKDNTIVGWGGVIIEVEPKSTK